MYYNRLMKKKVKSADLNEELDATGQENEEKAAKWVIEKEDRLEKEAKESEDAEKDILEKKRKFKFMDYKRTLAQLAARSFEDSPLPRGWRNHVAITDKGIVVYIVSPDHRPYLRAFTPVNDPKYDTVAVEKVIESAWVQVENWENAQQKTNGGIIMPDGSPKQVPSDGFGPTGERTEPPTKPS